jgi:hypothetical protein
MLAKELICEDTVEQIFKYLALFSPLLGLFAGAIFSSLKKSLSSLWWGIGLGFIGPFNLFLWHTYSLVLDKFGFDSVKAFLFNIFLFIVIGIFIGYLLALFLKQNKKEV